jgi:hypothetical protein
VYATRITLFLRHPPRRRSNSLSRFHGITCCTLCPNPNGPFFGCAVTCERVLREGDGVPSLIRIFDRWQATGTSPTFQPTIITSSMFIALKNGSYRGPVPVARGRQSSSIEFARSRPPRLQPSFVARGFPLHQSDRCFIKVSSSLDGIA